MVHSLIRVKLSHSLFNVDFNSLDPRRSPFFHISAMSNGNLTPLNHAQWRRPVRFSSRDARHSDVIRKNYHPVFRKLRVLDCSTCAVQCRARREYIFDFFSFWLISLSYNRLWTKATYDSDPQSLLNTLVVVT